MVKKTADEINLKSHEHLPLYPDANRVTRLPTELTSDGTRQWPPSATVIIPLVTRRTAALAAVRTPASRTATAASTEYTEYDVLVRDMFMSQSKGGNNIQDIVKIDLGINDHPSFICRIVLHNRRILLARSSGFAVKNEGGRLRFCTINVTKETVSHEIGSNGGRPRGIVRIIKLRRCERLKIPDEQLETIALGCPSSSGSGLRGAKEPLQKRRRWHHCRVQAMEELTLMEYCLVMVDQSVSVTLVFKALNVLNSQLIVLLMRTVVIHYSWSHIGCKMQQRVQCAAVFALSMNNTFSSPAKVVASAPYYSFYKKQMDFFSNGNFEFAGDANLLKTSSNVMSSVIELVTTPNNPDGVLRKPVLQGSFVSAIHDHAYYWPHFTAIPAPSDGNL
ncbi:unnamed protein product [Cuscuta campestris]|uniref:Alliinase C-terminal domain-containing protein n=1 Tax=Cuscuta campestris TaxID=132261 RepID=A0A484K5K6_9ASTE|nr:unnamed protein product [Cuscuta campestris]